MACVGSLSSPLQVETPPLLRIKRLRSEDPVEALLLHQSSKRAKVQFDYVGTRVEAEPKDLSLSAKDLKTRTKVPKNSLESRRAAKGAQSSISRYEFVSKNRGEGFCDVLKVQSEENTISCNGVALEEQKDYVYDFYYSTVSTKDLDLASVTNVYAYDHIVCQESSDEEEDESDDSNDENNYRNDYPDEESDEDYREEHSDEDYYGHFEKLRIRDTDSSEGELYSLDNYEEEEELNPLGSAYSRYKKRIAQEEDTDEEAEESDDS